MCVSTGFQRQNNERERETDWDTSGLSAVRGSVCILAEYQRQCRERERVCVCRLGASDSVERERVRVCRLGTSDSVAGPSQYV